jgi:hypothetical protein
MSFAPCVGRSTGQPKTNVAAYVYTLASAIRLNAHVTAKNTSSVAQITHWWTANHPRKKRRRRCCGSTRDLQLKALNVLPSTRTPRMPSIVLMGCARRGCWKVETQPQLHRLSNSLNDRSWPITALRDFTKCPQAGESGRCASFTTGRARLFCALGGGPLLTMNKRLRGVFGS